MGRFLLRLLLCFVIWASVCECSHAYGKITSDPNAGGAASSNPVAQPDARLAQMVSYEAKFQTVHQIIDDLSEMTGVKLYAGAVKSDWAVRARKMNIFVKDVTLADLMNSIAHAMKFAWSRDDDANPPTYRLLVDKKAAIAADAQKAAGDKKSEEIWQKRRQEWIDAIMEYGSKSPSELESLRNTNPMIYRYARYGALKALRALFEEVPETKRRFAAGEGFHLAANEVSSQTRSLFWSAGNEFWKYLQMIGYIKSSTPEPEGYGDMLKPDGNFDLAFTPGLGWREEQLFTGYFHIMTPDGKGKEVAHLSTLNQDFSRFLCEGPNRTLDQQAGIQVDSPDRDGQLIYAKTVKDLKDQEEMLYPSEPLNEHPDFPDLEKTVKLKIDPPKAEQNPVLAVNDYIASFQKALADATSLSIVSDSWVNIEGDRLPDQEAKLGELLDKFCEGFNYNWDKPSAIVEFRHRKWWKNRSNQIPDEWIIPWRENTRKNIVLSLDDLAEMSKLTYEQVEECLKADEVLGYETIYWKMVGNLDGHIQCLRLYSTLSPQLRALLMSGRGINGQMLTSQQWKQMQPIFDRIGGPSRGEIILHLERDPSNIHVIYYFRVIDNETGDVDRAWRVWLPRYEKGVEQQ